MSQNIGNRKTFNAFKCWSLSWWWYGAFTCIYYPFQTLQRTEIIVTISSTIILQWLLHFWWRWTWCANRYFRTSWTRRWWGIRCTQHFYLFFFFCFLVKIDTTLKLLRFKKAHFVSNELVIWCSSSKCVKVCNCFHCFFRSFVTSLLNWHYLSNPCPSIFVINCT